MRISNRACQLAGVSLLALTAAFVFEVSDAAACTATPDSTTTTTGSGVATVNTIDTKSVTVECRTTGDSQDVDGVFTTRFTGYTGLDNSSSTVIVHDYDGNGDDVVNIFGGIITDSADSTPVVSGLPPITTPVTPSLEPTIGTIELLGGNDRFLMSDGDYLGDPFAPDVQANLDTGAGDDSVTIESGRILNIELGDGADTATITGDRTTVGDVDGGAGQDRISVGVAITGGTAVFSAPTTGLISGGDGNDTVSIGGGNVAGVDGGAGNDTIEVDGGTVAGNVDGADGNDTVTVTGLAAIDGNIFGNAGNDTVNINGGTVGTTAERANVDLADGSDIFNMSAGHVTGSVLGEGGGNTYDVSGGTIDGSIFAGSQADKVTISGTAHIGVDPGDDGTGSDSVGLEGGDDNFTMTGGTLAGGVSGGDGTDTLDISGGSIATYVNGGAGNDVISLTNGAMVGGDVLGDDNDAEAGNDTVTIDGARVNGFVSVLAGNDTIIFKSGTIGTAAAPKGIDLGDGADIVQMSGGTVNGNVGGGAGNDAVTVSGGTVNGNVTGDGGDGDSIAISGGTINGNVDAETVGLTGGAVNGGINGQHVELHGGTVTGNVSGIGADTLVIDNIGSIDPLNLANGVTFSGIGANAQISDVDLAAGGSKTENFVGFDNVALSNATLAFAPGTMQQINNLLLGPGSTLYAPGNITLTGAVTATNATINMMNGTAGDVLTLGGITLNNSTIALDLNQQTGQADHLVAAAFAATGANVVNVNLIGAPNFTGQTDIPIIVSTGAPVTGTFTITGIPGTPGALFTYSVLEAPDGSLLIRATPAGFGIATAPDSAVNASIVDVAVDALYGINKDALDADLALANGSARIAISPSFGVFASGQFAHTEHDGYDVSDGGFSGVGPTFGADDFSAAISLDFNAAKHFGFDTKYGLNLGLFAGYASTDVGLDPFQGFVDIGGGRNRSGMFGGYALFRQDYNYALVSASAFIGNTDVSNGVLDTTGSYDTQGYAVTGSVGHIFRLGDRTRFDLRGGLLGVTFKGDSYTDSGGNEFGQSRISFGAVQFAPGIYGDFKLENAMVFSPYARLELQQRFGAKNTTEIDTRKVNFDDADFSAALSTGFNLKMTEATTLNGEVRGKWSTDSSTLGAKLGLKVAF
ncbi:autotransporter [Mesorhizobium sp. WSM4311]|nr:autotransporter [Mesorhizobium sp. WSM4311]TRD07868.1 autotransporter domain-containing protein [Mesorhizobium sp. WSM4305]